MVVLAFVVCSVRLGQRFVDLYLVVKSLCWGVLFVLLHFWEFDIPSAIVIVMLFNLERRWQFLFVSV